MNKNDTKNPRYIINWETHPRNLLKNFCSLMEHQSLVDVVLSCGNNTIQAHKFVLAANSALFREEFEKNPSIEQIIMSGCDFSVLKNVVEIMYCGQTVVSEDNVKFLVAAVKLFQMKHLENLFAEHAGAKEDIYLPKPQFLTKKPKYPAFTYQMPIVVPQIKTAQQQCGVSSASAQAQVTLPKVTASLVPISDVDNKRNKPMDFSISLAEPMPGFKSYGRGKRSLKQQAEQACVKEAQASRMALASLQKEIATAPQVSSFIIEDTCTETTVENFIPHPETGPYGQVLNYNDVINESLPFLPVSVAQNDLSHRSSPYSNLAAQSEKRPLTADKLKYILEAQIPANVEIMYKQADGRFVPINEEILRNLATKDGLQYQVVDEDGRVSEMQELEVIGNVVRDPITNAEIIEVPKPALEVGDFLKNTESTLSISEGLCSVMSKSGQETALPSPMDVAHSNLKLLTSPEPPKLTSEVDLKFSPDLFFADIISGLVHNEVTVIDDSMKATLKDEKFEKHMN